MQLQPNSLLNNNIYLQHSDVHEQATGTSGHQSCQTRQIAELLPLHQAIGHFRKQHIEGRIG